MLSSLIRLRAPALPTLVLASALCSTPAAATESTCKLQELAELPVTMVATRPTVKVTINGQEAVFLVDSGAFYSMIARDAVPRYGLQEEAMFDLQVRGIGGSELAGAATVKNFAIGAAGLGRQQFVVTKGMGSGMSGLIGQNILTILDTEFDLANGVIRLFKPAHCSGSVDLGYWAPGQAQTLPIGAPSSDRDRAITATATANGSRLRVLFDTGASLSGMSLGAAARAGVTPTSADVVQTGGASGFGDHVVRTWVAPFKSFALGGEEIRSTHLRITDMNLQNADMLLGADFFLSHRILISQSQRKIYFTYNGGPVFQLTNPAQRAMVADAPTPPGEAAPGQPADADGFARRAAASMGRREPGPAIEDLNRAIALTPDNAELYIRRADARLMNRQGALAVADLDEAIRRKPSAADALLRRAAISIAQQDHARAKADLDTAAKLEIDDPSVRLRLAGLYEGAGDTDASIAEYDRWIHDHPKDGELPQALNGACWNRAMAKRELDQALKDCDTAVRMRPGAANILDSRALVHLNRGEFDLAIADYDAALKIQPKAAITLYARGVAKQRKGLQQAGQTDIQLARALNARVADQARRYGLTP